MIQEGDNLFLDGGLIPTVIVIDAALAMTPVVKIAK